MFTLAIALAWTKLNLTLLASTSPNVLFGRGNVFTTAAWVKPWLFSINHRQVYLLARFIRKVARLQRRGSHWSREVGWGTTNNSTAFLPLNFNFRILNQIKLQIRACISWHNRASFSLQNLHVLLSLCDLCPQSRSCHLPQPVGANDELCTSWRHDILRTSTRAGCLLSRLLDWKSIWDRYHFLVSF